jgi:hypothetical protein
MAGSVSRINAASVAAGDAKPLAKRPSSAEADIHARILEPGGLADEHALSVLNQFRQAAPEARAQQIRVVPERQREALKPMASPQKISRGQCDR